MFSQSPGTGRTAETKERHMPDEEISEFMSEAHAAGLPLVMPAGSTQGTLLLAPENSLKDT